MMRVAEIAQRRIGMPLAIMVGDQIGSGTTPPPNALSTQQQKGHGMTLVRSGETSKNIRSTVEQDSTGAIILTIGPVGDDKLQMKFWANEMVVPANVEGTEPLAGQRIPTRSTLRKIIDEHGDQKVDDALQEIGDLLEVEWTR
jgi:hypothetical protein